MKFDDNKADIYFIALHVIIFVVVYSIYWPPMYTVIDENNYLEMAYVLREGHVFPDNLGLNFNFLIPFNGHLVSIYPIGTSLLLAPFTCFGWRAMFMLNMLLFLMAFIIFIKLLKHCNISPIYSLLFLYYPSSVLYARTLMSDIPSLFFIMAGCYAYFLGGKWLYTAGALLGFSCFIRHPNWVIVIILFIAMLYNIFKNYSSTAFINLFSDVMKFIIGFFPFSVAIFYYNYCTMGNLFRNPYNLIAEGGNPFALKLIPQNLAFYFYALIIFYPLMIFAPLLANIKHKIMFNCIFWSLCILYSGYLKLHKWGTSVQDYVIGIRYLLAVIFIALLAYSSLLQRFAKHYKKIGIVFVAFMHLLCIPYFALTYRHYSYAKEWDILRSSIYFYTKENSLIVSDPDTSKLLAHIWGKRTSAIYVHVNRRYPVEQKINEAIAHHNNVYIALIIRPYREDLSKYAIKYKNEILSEYSYAQLASIKSSMGALFIYEILSPK